MTTSLATEAIKVLLRDLIQYQKDNAYPFDFFTEASLDLAEDEELMELMAEANIISCSSASRAQ